MAYGNRKDFKSLNKPNFFQQIGDQRKKWQLRLLLKWIFAEIVYTKCAQSTIGNSKCAKAFNWFQ